MAEMETVNKYRPSALTLTDPDTKEVLFRVGISGNSVSDYGIGFGGVSNGEDKLATATLPIPADTEDAKAYVLDKAGLAIASLNKIEEGIKEALDSIRTERNAVASSISISV
jgi:hypothetical protein